MTSQLNMDLLKQFNDFVKREKLFHLKDALIIAVSGGVDSMVLAHLIKASGINFAIAHCNFDLRGEESKMDEHLVVKIAESYGVPCFHETFKTAEYAAKHKLSIQEAARLLRYFWFNELLTDNKAGLKYDHILTAHHADDNAETILMNFFKGTGINGLKGILSKNDKVVRPLLFARKLELVEYAKENKVEYREDSSNKSDKYTRNYYRNRIIPQLEEQVPGVTDHVIAQAQRFKEIKVIYDIYFDQLFKKLIEKRKGSVQIPVLKLLQSPVLHTLLYELAHQYGFTAAQVPEIEKVLHATSGKYITSSSHRMLKNRNWLIISKTDEEEQLFTVIEKGDKEVKMNSGILRLKEMPKPEQVDKNSLIAQLDNRDINYPLILRKWKQGDYFYPLGMQKKKKLSRFFIDLKLSIADKENTWVIESGKRIIWIVGHRIDDRFKIINGTSNVLQISLVPEK